MTRPGSGWPFWAPSEAAIVQRALDVAGLRPGERFVDLGCGDGSVLVAAAERGAVVHGVESDDELVAQARKNLDAAGVVDGTVSCGDVFDVPLDDADVLFTYLSPATLQRLVGRLGSAGVRPGTRLVTVDYAIPGVASSSASASADASVHLYWLPPRPLPPDAAVGWDTAGLLVAAVPEHESLTALELAHPGGAVSVSVGGGLVGAVDVATGADELPAGSRLAIDLRWAGYEAGTLLQGAISVGGLDPLPVVAFYTDDHVDHLWELTSEGVSNVSTWLAAGHLPSSFDDLLNSTDG